MLPKWPCHTDSWLIIDSRRNVKKPFHSMNKHLNTKSLWLRLPVSIQIRVQTSHSNPPRDRLGIALHEAHHGKRPMDGIGGTVKNTIGRKVWLTVQKNSPDMLIRSAKSIHATFQQLKFQTSLRVYSIHLQYLLR